VFRAVKTNAEIMVRVFLNIECTVNWQQVLFHSRDCCPGTAAGPVRGQKETAVLPGGKALRFLKTEPSCLIKSCLHYKVQKTPQQSTQTAAA